MVLMALYSFTHLEDYIMAYYLKKTKLKGRTYLSICESYYHPEKKETAQKLYKSLGSVESLVKSGMEDPISFYKEEVVKLNEEFKRQKEEKKVQQIGESPLKYAGYFLLKSTLEKLGVKGYLDLMQSVRDFRFSLYDMIQALVYARCVAPCSKSATFHDVLPQLFDDFDISYDQILDACEYIGQEYEKLVEIFTACCKEKFGVKTDKTYFDCTNFYFEIDKENDFQKKGPSKENKKEPLVGLGLLLDANQIPIGMQIYPGNKSEKPVLRDVIKSLKNRNNIKGRTVQVADKGLNCADNIFAAKKDGDGYIFSKSVKTLPEIEKDWVKIGNDWVDVVDTDGVIKYRYKSCIDKFKYNYTKEDGRKAVVELTEKRLLTYNPSLAKKQEYEINKEAEKARMLCLSKAKKNEYGDCSKYVTFKSTSKGQVTDDKVIAELNEDAVKKAKELAGYNLIVTSEINMSENEIYETYHNLWKIEESFRIMKSDLDARPVFLQKEASIKGHFTICYIAVLLERLLQYKIFKNEYSASQLMTFIRNFQLVKVSERKYINVTPSGAVINSLADATSLPLTNYFLGIGDIHEMMRKKL